MSYIFREQTLYSITVTSSLPYNLLYMYRIQEKFAPRYFQSDAYENDFIKLVQNNFLLL